MIITLIMIIGAAADLAPPLRHLLPQDPAGADPRLGPRLYYYAVLYYTILDYTILYYTILYFTILYYSVLHGLHYVPILCEVIIRMLYHIILYHIILLYYIILYHTI